MPAKLRHVAIKVTDLDTARKFYQNILGMKLCRENKVRDHISCHLTDGVIDLALMVYDEGDTSTEAKHAPPGNCIHHIGFETDNLAGTVEEMEKQGYSVLSDPSMDVVKMKAPDTPLIEFASDGFFDGIVKEAGGNETK